MSLTSGTIKFQFCSLFVKALRELYALLKTSSESDFCPTDNNKIQKGISSYNWIYLKINIPDIRLILLGHIFRKFSRVSCQKVFLFAWHSLYLRNTKLSDFLCQKNNGSKNVNYINTQYCKMLCTKLYLLMLYDLYNNHTIQFYPKHKAPLILLSNTPVLQINQSLSTAIQCNTLRPKLKLMEYHTIMQ